MERQTEIEQLIEKLGNPDWNVRRTAIEQLMDIPETHYIPLLEEAIRDDRDTVRRNGAMECFRALGLRAVEPLTRRLVEDHDEEVRLFAANILGDIRHDKAVPALISALKDPDVNVRVASAEALGNIGAPEATEPLGSLIDDEPWVALAAIKALGDIGGEKCLEVLHRWLEHPEYRGMVFDAIEQTGTPESIRRLSHYVEHDELRELALKAIIRIAERSGVRPMPTYFINLVPLLLELQESPDKSIRKSAFIALSWSEDPRGLSIFINSLGDEDLQEYAVSALLALGKFAVSALIDALKDRERRERELLANMLAMMGEHMALLQFADDPEPDVRVEVARALKHLKIPKARVLAERMLEDQHEEVRLAARQSCEHFGLI